MGLTITIAIILIAIGYLIGYAIFSPYKEEAESWKSSYLRVKESEAKLYDKLYITPYLDKESVEKEDISYHVMD